MMVLRYSLNGQSSTKYLILKGMELTHSTEQFEEDIQITTAVAVLGEESVMVTVITGEDHEVAGEITRMDEGDTEETGTIDLSVQMRRLVSNVKCVR